MASTTTTQTYEIRSWAAGPITHVVAASGEIDLHAAPALRETLASLAGQGRRNIVLDMSGATFMDSTAIGVLAGHVRTAGSVGGTLTVAGANENVARILDVSGIARALAICDTLDDAVELRPPLRPLEIAESTHGCVPRTLELHVSPKASELARVRGFAAAAAFRFGLDPRERHNFMVAASEAVTNAIEHGRPCGDQTIQLWVTEEDGTLTLGVRDAGEFQLEPLPADPLPEGGRGLKLMSHLVDSVRLSRTDGHTHVELSKHRG
jgi:anti-sigma B factor antagonist